MPICPHKVRTLTIVPSSFWDFFSVLFANPIMHVSILEDNSHEERKREGARARSCCASGILAIYDISVFQYFPLEYNASVLITTDPGE